MNDEQELSLEHLTWFHNYHIDCLKVNESDGLERGFTPFQHIILNGSSEVSPAHEKLHQRWLDWESAIIESPSLILPYPPAPTEEDVMCETNPETYQAPPPPDPHFSPEGTKYDAGKPRFDLIPPVAEEQVAAVLKLGADKYGPNNWRDVEPERYIAAAMRHINQHRQGDLIDAESSQTHLAHAVCSLMFAIELKD